jgi:6-phosphogluconolactonase (cycloisomerase 2 family)
VGAKPEALAINSGHLYVANAGSDTVSAFAVDQNTGSLMPLSPATYPTGKSPSSLALDAVHDMLYVANNGGSNDISGFKVDETTGNLTPLAGSPFPAGGNPLSLDLAAGAKFLYSANPDATNPSISGFIIDPATGELSQVSGSPFPAPVSHYMAIEQTGVQNYANGPTLGYLYVTVDASIVGYALDWATGALTALPGFPVAAGANAYAVNIAGNQFLYAVNDGAANISGFALDLLTGALTPMAGSPFPAPPNQFLAY